MAGLVRRAFLIAVFGLLVAASAMAGIPTTFNSDIPVGFSLVGCSGTVADPAGVFTIGPIRDVDDNPVANCFVEIDFTDCCNDIRLSANQFYGNVDPNFVRAGKVIGTIANSAGIATFVIMGAATSLGLTPAVGCATVYADGINMTGDGSHPLVQVSAYDLDGAKPGANGLGPSDLSLWLSDFFSSPVPYRARADYDYPITGVKNVGVADLARWVNRFWSTNSSSNGPTFVSCP